MTEKADKFLDAKRAAVKRRAKAKRKAASKLPADPKSKAPPVSRVASTRSTRRGGRGR